MTNVLRKILGALIKLTSISPSKGFAARTKPCIYIANSTDPRSELATYYALKGGKACLLVSHEQYSKSRVLRTVNKNRIIAAVGGINTEWFHSALRRIKSGESILLFPQKNGGVIDAAFVLLSLLSGAEIVPIHTKSRRGLFCMVYVTAGKPISPDSAAALTVQQIRREDERARKELSALAGAAD